MPGNKKSRKRYVPYRDNINPMHILAINSRETLTPLALAEIIIHARTSLTSLMEGKGIEDDLANLAVASNIGLVLCEAGIGTEFIGVVKRAQEVIVRHTGIAQGHGIVPAFNAQDDITALVELLDLHDQQIAHEDFNTGRMTEARIEITHRINSGHALRVWQ